MRAERDRVLTERMRVLAKENPTYGYRFIWALLRREGRMVNRKRVHRLWKEADPITHDNSPSPDHSHYPGTAYGGIA